MSATSALLPSDRSGGRRVHVTPDLRSPIPGRVEAAVVAPRRLVRMMRSCPRELTNSTDEAPFICADSGPARAARTGSLLEVVAEGLNFPMGLDFGPDGALYLSLPSGSATGARERSPGSISRFRSGVRLRLAR